MKRTIFIGQAMPRFKKDPQDWPSLNSWLYSIGIGDEQIRINFLYSALVDYFPGSKNGSHSVPTSAEIEKERKRLSATITTFSPELVVPTGKLSISHCLNDGECLLKDCIGRSYFVDPYNLLARQVRVIPLPHPSGASTWRHNPENRKLLLKALELLKQELAI